MTANLERLKRAFVTVSDFAKAPLTGPLEMDVSTLSDEKVRDVKVFITYHAALRETSPSFFGVEGEDHRPRLCAHPPSEPIDWTSQARFAIGKKECFKTPEPVAQKFEEQMERLGTEKFSEIFCNILSEEENVLDPQELFLFGDVTEEEAKEWEKAEKEHRRAFNLAMYRTLLQSKSIKENPGSVAQRFAVIADELPSEKILVALNTYHMISASLK